MWGTYLRSSERLKQCRFIPTYVGNIIWPQTLTYFDLVHPHVCGEHFAPYFRMCFWPGSSPRMWGTWQWPGKYLLYVWFIPTYVGNISITCPIRNGVSVHPHVCGEHGLWPLHHPANYGSSPRMWGTSLTISTPTVPARFIPTYVGNIFLL